VLAFAEGAVKNFWQA